MDGFVLMDGKYWVNINDIEDVKLILDEINSSKKKKEILGKLKNKYVDLINDYVNLNEGVQQIGR
jgi:hypothetical protein